VQVFRIENEQDGQTRCDFVPVFCQHCDEPECLAACPYGAITRDGEGLIQIEKNLCCSCGACVNACPFGAIFIQAGEEGSFAQKCDLCPERRGRGFLTSCEQHCLGQAFTSCNEEQKNTLTKGRTILNSP
jgi:tetrathionate reductase subunit B